MEQCQICQYCDKIKTPSLQDPLENSCYVDRVFMAREIIYPKKESSGVMVTCNNFSFILRKKISRVKAR